MIYLSASSKAVNWARHWLFLGLIVTTWADLLGTGLRWIRSPSTPIPTADFMPRLTEFMPRCSQQRPNVVLVICRSFPAAWLYASTHGMICLAVYMSLLDALDCQQMFHLASWVIVGTHWIWQFTWCFKCLQMFSCNGLAVKPCIWHSK